MSGQYLPGESLSATVGGDVKDRRVNRERRLEDLADERAVDR